MNCKPGDLAYLSSDCIDEGVIMEVLSMGPKIDGHPSWHCHSRTAIECEKMEGGKNVGGKYFMTDILVEDRYLRPISGVPVNDEVRDEVTA